jgi:hypothetical protein
LVDVVRIGSRAVTLTLPPLQDTAASTKTTTAGNFSSPIGSGTTPLAPLLLEFPVHQRPDTATTGGSGQHHDSSWNNIVLSWSSLHGDYSLVGGIYNTYIRFLINLIFS